MVVEISLYFSDDRGKILPPSEIRNPLPQYVSSCHILITRIRQNITKTVETNISLSMKWLLLVLFWQKPAPKTLSHREYRSHLSLDVNVFTVSFAKLSQLSQQTPSQKLATLRIEIKIANQTPIS
jgi:hypothetical protein